MPCASAANDAIVGANGNHAALVGILELRAVLEAQKACRIDIEKKTGRVVTVLFFRYQGGHVAAIGNPILSIRGVWEKACKDAGVPEALFHDSRRTAARNLIRSGVAQPVSMALTGHKTVHVFHRYDIIDEAMLQESSPKLSAHLRKAKTDRTVVPIRETGS